MMFNNNGYSLADIAAVSGNGGNNGSGFGFGGDGAWVLIVFILLLVCGWGGNGNGLGNNGGATGGNGLYPWMNQSNELHEGFRDQMINDNITGIRSDINGISTQLCNGFNGTQMSILQSANALQSQLAQCCCDNRLGIADLKYTVATENCADRTQSMINTRDIIDSQTRGTQAILDKLCALELDNLKQDNANLRTQLNMAALRESQTAQNAFIQAGLTNEVDALYNRLSNCPVPSIPVYGRQPIFTCSNNNGCGCGCGMN